GITEAMNLRDTEYGRERLVEAVRRRRDASAQRIVASVFDEVEIFSRGGTHDDDRVLLVLKVL
ncbi:MAG: SpoIIE family protein phosphatase, partial [Acidobacteria bacterium]|nr:SpoIIE family protein phosphatase [Acidobacteriota bacterium]